MADWTNITDTAVDPDAPLTSQLAYAWRDNPIAMGEGAAGAPYVHTGWHPYNGVFVGDGVDGVVYDFAVHGAVADVVSPDFDDGYEYRFIFDGVSGTLGAMNINLYGETSATYSVDSVIYNSQVAFYGIADILNPRKVSSGVLINSQSGNVSSINVAMNTSFVKIGLASPQKILKAKLSYPGYTIASGKINMYRRLAY